MARRRVKGFRFSGIHAGIKPPQEPDLGLIAADAPATAVGVFTQNRVRAAPVILSERRLRKGRCQAVLVNSGNANACTGRQGHEAALTTTQAAAKSLGIAPSLVAVASTGVIGVQLPVDPIRAAVPDLVERLGVDQAESFARAIMTTDRGPKLAAAEFMTGRTRCRVVGVAKGAGMIHPSMATMLAFVLTDASLGRATLGRALRHSTELTFNRATVDGDTSTNDSIFALASGAASGKLIEQASTAGRRFVAALTEVLEALCKMCVADGEGAKHLVRVEVEGARSDRTAVAIARTIATSQLVKTAFYGCDPNWGRILAAAGRAGEVFDPARVSIRIGRVTIFANGQPRMTAKSEAAAAATMRRPEYTIEVTVGQGRGSGHYWTCDLGHEYVRINADYRT